MYIKHKKLVLSTEKIVIPGASFLDLGPLRVLGPKQALFSLLFRYQWPIGLSDHNKLYKTYQAILENRYGTLISPCLQCKNKVMCLVSSHTEMNYDWPKEICPYLNSSSDAIADRKIPGEKVRYNKLKFVYDHKCDSCGLKSCCYNYSLIIRMLCTHFTQMEKIQEKAEKEIANTWGSEERFMAALSASWQEVYFKPSCGKRRRKFRVAFIHPDQTIDLIQDYYPFHVHNVSIPAYKAGLVIPEKQNTKYIKEDILTAWLLWKMAGEQITSNRNGRCTGLGRIWISGHHNFLLSLNLDNSGHPVLVTSTSRWRYSTVFESFHDIGWKLNWSACQVKTCLGI